MLFFAWLAREMTAVRGELASLRSQQVAMGEEHRNLERRGRELEAELARGRTAASAESESLRRRLAEGAERIAGLEQKSKAPRRTAAPVVVSMVLSAGVRSDEVPRLALPTAAEFVELRVGLDDDLDPGRLRADLTTDDGAHLWTEAGLEVFFGDWGPEVEVRLAAEILRPGRYVLALEGPASAGAPRILARYRFEVIED